MKIFHVTTKWLLNGHVKRISLPRFQDGELVRYRISFIGKVQHVGFRAEVDLLAKRMGITGLGGNQGRRKVIIEVQGTEQKINALIDVLKNERRFRLDEIIKEPLAIVVGEKRFKIIKESDKCHE